MLCNTAPITLGLVQVFVFFFNSAALLSKSLFFYFSGLEYLVSG